jgi:N-acetylneuraminic acid mutarotase
MFRSGHRMVVWRNYLVLFGGFYEAMRDVRWFHDLYLFSFQDERWTQIQYRPHAQVPKPRSGVQMCVHANEDTVYIYGGYSKEKLPGQKKEGRIHEDM